MSADAWITLATLAAMIVVMMRGIVSPPAAIVGATATVYALGVVDADEALSGLSNPAPISVAGLYLVAGAVSKADLLSPVVRRLVGDNGGARRSLARLAVPAAGASAFLANTPIVAMLVPAVVQWCDERRVSASRFLLPLSYATILGGALTVVGTSTNLVASGLAEETGMGAFGLFEPATIALPVVLVGLVITVVFGPVLLPARRQPRDTDPDERPFTLSMRVAPDSALVGMTVEAAGLRHLEGVYLVEIERTDSIVAPVAPDRRLDADDRLVFVGDLANVMDLHGRDGLEALTDDAPMAGGTFYEVVVGPSSPLAGRTLRDAGFRSRHHAAVVAIHRAGTRLSSKLGEIVLHPGDSLLLHTGDDFSGDSADARADFVVCTRLGPATRPERDRVRTGVTLAALLLAVGLPALGITSVLRGVTIASGVLFVGGVIRPRDVWQLVDLRIVAMIAGAFGLGHAVAASGLAADFADAIIDASSGTGDLGAVLGVLLAAMILTELVTNAAAVALIFPTGLSVAEITGVDPQRMAIGMAVAASASFLTPIGYQTNTMVWGPGRYHFADYLRLGIPLWIVAWVGTALMVIA